jgi:eukaryotic-like serine/threonine-protein kinase
MTTPPPEDAETRLAAPPPPGPDGLEPGPSRQLGWGMLLGALVLIAVGGAIAAVYFATRDDEAKATTTSIATATTSALPAARVFVPDVTGLEQDEAASRLVDAHLVPVVRYRPTKKPSGLVVSQTPKAGKHARRGANVRILVDRGAPRVAVPDVTGMDLADAGSKLSNAGLEAQTTQVTVVGKPPGTVVSQAPAAGGKADRGTVVTLSIARGAPVATTTAAGTTTTAAATTGMTTTGTTAATTTAPPMTASVPDLSGSDVQAATQALMQANLLASVQYVPSEDPLGSVVEQAPAAGGSAQALSRVTVNVSSGPGQKQLERVPDATGQTLDQAVSTLNAAGLRLIFVKLPVATRAKVGKVVEQTPAAGKTAPKNAQVLVYLGVTR